jgi:hypothetical protein
MALLNNAQPLTSQVREDSDARTGAAETVLASLPPLLMGIMLSVFLLSLVPLNQIVWGGPTNVQISGSILRAYLAAGTIGAALFVFGLYGSVQRLPLWSYTWATGAVFVVLFGLLILGEELPFLISPTVDMFLMLSLVGLLAVMALVGALRAVDDAALVGMGFGGTFATASTFFATAGPFSRLDIGLLSTPVGLAFALLIVTYVRGGPAAKRISVAAAALLNAALIWIYRAVILSVQPAVSDQSFHWRLLAIALVGLLAPLCLSWLFGKQRLASER